jgi:succinylarginine dihydrolase
MRDEHAVEVNFDGLPGPTHNFAGLAAGNLASENSAGSRSWPRRAALQSIDKMRRMLDMGLVQGVLPPHPRPDFVSLRRMGFRGSDADIVSALASDAPQLRNAVFSSSFMWVANAATVSAAADTNDGRIHFTTANLASQVHRNLEHEHTGHVLATVFGHDAFFAHHAPLPCPFSDEGAANHTRLTPRYGDPGVSLFVYGRRALSPEKSQSSLPARQTLEASLGVARQHGLDPATVVCARQLPAAIDAGVFHNDVICVGNRRLLFLHEQSFEDQDNVLAALDERLRGTLLAEIVPRTLVSLDRAVSTYLFNSQLVSPPNQPDAQILIAPMECREDTVVCRYLESLVNRGVLHQVEYVDVRESMQNGGGPACLRLRVAMSPQAIAVTRGHAIVTHEILDALQDCVESHYPESINTGDLGELQLLEQARRAIVEIHRLLDLTSLTRAS